MKNKILENYIDEMKVHVTYQDTDLGGVVYFANYLNYGEKARAKFFRSIFGQTKFIDQNWAVRNVQCNYFYPAVLDDDIIVKTSIKKLTKAHVVFIHDCFVNDNVICSQEVQVVSIDNNLKLAKILPHIFEKLNSLYNKIGN